MLVILAYLRTLLSLKYKKNTKKIQKKGKITTFEKIL